MRGSFKFREDRVTGGRRVDFRVGSMGKGGTGRGSVWGEPLGFEPPRREDLQKVWVEKEWAGGCTRVTEVPVT